MQRSRATMIDRIRRRAVTKVETRIPSMTSTRSVMKPYLYHYMREMDRWMCTSRVASIEGRTRFEKRDRTRDGLTEHECRSAMTFGTRATVDNIFEQVVTHHEIEEEAQHDRLIRKRRDRQGMHMILGMKRQK